MRLKRLKTSLVHLGRSHEYCLGSVNPVIQRASSIVFDSVEEKQHAIKHRNENTLFYGRKGTLTHFAFQKAMCELEKGAGCALFPCGAAAVANSILSFVKTGDNVLMTAGAYEPTQLFCNQILSSLGVSTTYYDPAIGADIKNLIQTNTQVVFLESPSSITMEVMDVKSMVSAIREKSPEAVIMIDNTWSAGVLFQALSHDIDISIQAGTKYIIGHSDAMIGTAVANSRCWSRLNERTYLMGQTVDADTAYLASRGLRTLGVRLEQHHHTGIKVATWLSQCDCVALVNHPALPQCVGHEYYLRDFLGSCGLFSFVLKKTISEKELALFLDKLTHFKMAYSWGGFESLILAIQPDEIKKIRPVGDLNISGTLFRLHIGLENADDLILDLEQGFKRLNL